VSINFKLETVLTLLAGYIVTQMRFIFVTGVISDVGTDYVDISLRGYATMDEVFEGTTDVSDIEGACSGK
jgi:hypothetical protein